MYQEMTNGWVLRLEDGANIPPDPENGDYRQYLAWVDAGNTPLPAAKPTVHVSEIEQQERQTLIHERAAEDPAYAALAKQLGVL